MKSFQIFGIVFTFLCLGGSCLDGMAIENWQQMVGRDRRALVERPEECQQLCASNPDCLFWTYKSDVIKPAGSTGGGVIGVAGTDSNCLIKANRENMTPNSDFVSGSKNCTFPALRGIFRSN